MIFTFWSLSLHLHEPEAQQAVVWEAANTAQPSGLFQNFSATSLASTNKNHDHDITPKRSQSNNLTGTWKWGHSSYNNITYIIKDAGEWNFPKSIPKEPYKIASQSASYRKNIPPRLPFFSSNSCQNCQETCLKSQCTDRSGKCGPTHLRATSDMRERSLSGEGFDAERVANSAGAQFQKASMHRVLQKIQKLWGQMLNV